MDHVLYYVYVAAGVSLLLGFAMWTFYVVMSSRATNAGYDDFALLYGAKALWVIRATLVFAVFCFLFTYLFVLPVI